MTAAEGKWLVSQGSGAPPKVSIVMPVLNSSAYLEEAIGSVLHQSFQDWELICIDDGSTDESLCMLLAVARRDQRISVYAQANAGQSSARNQGIHAARGQYLYFLDSDDVLGARALEALCSKADAERLDMLFFDAVPICEEGAPDGAFERFSDYYARSRRYDGVRPGPELFIDMVGNGDYVVQPCLFLTRLDHVRRNGLEFPEGMIHEDNVYTLECLLTAERASHLDQSLYIRRIRPGSTMTNAPSFPNCYGCFRSATDIIGFCAGKGSLAASDAMSEVASLVAAYLLRAQRLFCDLGIDDGEWQQLVSPGERVAFASLVAIPARSLRHGDELERQVRELQRIRDERDAMEHSTSYRLGKLLTTPFRFLKDGRARASEGDSGPIRKDA